MSTESSEHIPQDEVDAMTHFRELFNHKLYDNGKTAVLTHEQVEAVKAVTKPITTRVSKNGEFDPEAKPYSEERPFLRNEDEETGLKEFQQLLEERAEDQMTEWEWEEEQKVVCREWMSNEKHLIRYLRARDFNMEKTWKMFKGSMEYRAESDPDTVACELCGHYSKFHDTRLVGFCRQGRPVIYSTFGQALSTEPYGAVQHLNVCVEQGLRCIEIMDQQAKEDGVDILETVEEKMIWVQCFNGFGYKDMTDPRGGQILNDLFSNQYPERIRKIVLVNPPWVFWALWKALQLIVEQEIRDKVVFAYTDSDAKEKFLEIMDGEVAQWLLDTIEEESNGCEPLPEEYEQYMK